MATQNDVRRIAKALPGAVEGRDRFAFAVKNRDKEKGFVWVWLERIDPKKARVPNPKVLAVRVADLLEKDMLLGIDERKFFTEPHYAGYPAILVRLPAIAPAELKAIVTSAWRCVAPQGLVDRLDARRSAKKPAPARRKAR